MEGYHSLRFLAHTDIAVNLLLTYSILICVHDFCNIDILLPPSLLGSLQLPWSAAHVPWFGAASLFTASTSFITSHIHNWRLFSSSSLSLFILPLVTFSLLQQPIGHLLIWVNLSSVSYLSFHTFISTTWLQMTGKKKHRRVKGYIKMERNWGMFFYCYIAISHFKWSYSL